MPGELAFFVLGLLAILIWSPMLLASAAAARLAYKFLMGRGAGSRAAFRAAGGVLLTM